MNTKLYTEIVSTFHSTINADKKKKFNLSANVVSSLFDRNLNRHYKGLAKVRIDLSNKKDFYLFSEPCKVSPICHIDKSFDFENYFAQNKLERRKIILETMYESIKDMCQKLNYDLEPFTIAYEKVKDLDYINKFVYKKLTFSRNRKNKAGIEIETNEDAATISVLFTDRNEKPMQKVEILKTLPHDMFIYRAIHKGKWISPNEYQVSDSSGQVNFIANLLGGSTIKYVPKSGTQEKLKEAVNELNLQLV